MQTVFRSPRKKKRKKKKEKVNPDTIRLKASLRTIVLGRLQNLKGQIMKETDTITTVILELRNIKNLIWKNNVRTMKILNPILRETR